MIKVAEIQGLEYRRLIVDPKTIETERRAAECSAFLSAWKDEDDRRDPVDALHDAYAMLAEASRIEAIYMLPELRYVLADRLRHVHLGVRSYNDRRRGIVYATLLVEHNTQRCAALGLPVDESERESLKEGDHDAG